MDYDPTESYVPIRTETCATPDSILPADITPESLFNRWANFAGAPSLAASCPASDLITRKRLLKRFIQLADVIRERFGREEVDPEMYRDEYAIAAVIVSVLHPNTLPACWDDLPEPVRRALSQMRDDAAFVGEGDRRDTREAFAKLLWCVGESVALLEDCGQADRARHITRVAAGVQEKLHADSSAKRALDGPQRLMIDSKG